MRLHYAREHQEDHFCSQGGLYHTLLLLDEECSSPRDEEYPIRAGSAIQYPWTAGWFSGYYPIEFKATAYYHRQVFNSLGSRH